MRIGARILHFRTASGILARRFSMVLDFLHSDPQTLAGYFVFLAGALVFGFFAMRQELARRKLDRESLHHFGDRGPRGCDWSAALRSPGIRV